MSVYTDSRFSGVGPKAAPEIIPACTQCQTKKYVIRDRTAEKIGTTAGGVIGAVAYCLTKTEEPIGIAVGILIGVIYGSAVGNVLGERIDSKIRIQYRCRKCGAVIQG